MEFGCRCTRIEDADAAQPDETFLFQCGNRAGHLPIVRDGPERLGTSERVRMTCFRDRVPLLQPSFDFDGRSVVRPVASSKAVAAEREDRHNPATMSGRGVP